MAKKRRKKNSHVKRSTRLARAQARDLAVVTVAGSNNNMPQVFSLSTLKPVAVSDLVKRAFMQLKFHWTVSILVVARSQLGDEYIKAMQATFHGRYDNANEPLNEHQERLKKDVNAMHYVTEAWIAVPKNMELTEDQESAMLDAMGAFDNLARWESER